MDLRSGRLVSRTWKILAVFKAVPFQAPEETARNGMKPKPNLWQFKPPGLLGLDLEGSARDRRLRHVGTQFSSRAGCRNSRKQLWRVAGERRAPPTHEHSAWWFLSQVWGWYRMAFLRIYSASAYVKGCERITMNVYSFHHAEDYCTAVSETRIQR